MNSSIKAIIFDFGGVLINWDPHRVFQKFFPNDPQAMNDFMDEIGFSEWNLQQDEGYPFAQAVTDLSAQVSTICPYHPRVRCGMGRFHYRYYPRNRGFTT